MKYDVPLKGGIIIPEHELEFTTSRSGGAGGQHVNKTDSRITVRWNVHTTSVLNPQQKEQVIKKLHARLTSDGDLIVHNSQSRSQLQNKKNALINLASDIEKALHVPKKRKATRVPQSAKETRLKSKSKHSKVKKLRNKKINFDS